MSARSGPLRPGEPAPDFTVTSVTGGKVDRASLLGRRTVLYFYPRANSAGCSLEAREFARHHAEFAAAGVTVVGVSVDSVDSQRRFQDACNLPFELVADTNGELSRRFGVLGRLGLARRTTFLIGPTGTVTDVVRTWRPRQHVRAALERLVGPPPPP